MPTSNARHLRLPLRMSGKLDTMLKIGTKRGKLRGQRMQGSYGCISHRRHCRQSEFRSNPEIFANRLQKMLRSAATLGRRAVARGLASKRNASTLVLATHNNTSLNPSTLNTVTAASKIGGEVRLGHGALGIMGRFGISPQPGMSFAGSNEEAFEARGECIGRCAARTCMGKLWRRCRNAQQ